MTEKHRPTVNMQLVWKLIVTMIFNLNIGNGPTPLSNHVSLYKCINRGLISTKKASLIH